MQFMSPHFEKNTFSKTTTKTCLILKRSHAQLYFKGYGIHFKLFNPEILYVFNTFQNKKTPLKSCTYGELCSLANNYNYVIM